MAWGRRRRIHAPLGGGLRLYQWIPGREGRGIHSAICHTATDNEGSPQEPGPSAQALDPTGAPLPRVPVPDDALAPVVGRAPRILAVMMVWSVEYSRRTKLNFHDERVAS